VLADSNKKANELEDTIHDRPHHTVNIANRHWLVGANDSIYYYDNFDGHAAQLHNMTVFEPRTQPYRLAGETYARIVKCPDLVCQDGRWEADSGWVQRFGKSVRPVRTRFATKRLALKTVKVFTLAQVDATMMTFGELRDYIRRSHASGFNITEEEVNLQSKMAFPAVTLVMTALAIPFAVTTGRRGALYGIGVAIVLAVMYWLLMAFFLAAGKAGLLPPPLAAWATNILFMAAAMYLVLTVRT
jgi:lipopolysaccharide export LptBFGC system permease protein LptF